jgi:hypothetical protein
MKNTYEYQSFRNRIVLMILFTISIFVDSYSEEQ